MATLVTNLPVHILIPFSITREQVKELFVMYPNAIINSGRACLLTHVRVEDGQDNSYQDEAAVCKFLGVPFKRRIYNTWKK